MSDNILNLLIGMLFGASLDFAGFGSAKKLNAQFALRDFSMFKIMFGAIAFAACLYFLFLNFGFPPVENSVVPTLNLGLLFGGFLLGIGLVLGGYCPGTAITGAAGGRVDAIIFFVMMYPGYRFWTWLEPKLPYDFHQPLARNNLTLPELFDVPVFFVLLILTLVGWLGWRIGNYFEAKQF